MTLAQIKAELEALLVIVDALELGDDREQVLDLRRRIDALAREVS